MKNKLKINGFSKIASGKITASEILTIKDTKIKMVQYNLDGKIFVMFETFLSYIGYTDNLDFAQNLAVQSKDLTFSEFCQISGR